jgi:hypothetical protein
MSTDPRSELEATLAARRELGPDHDEELISGFLERLEHRVGDRRPGAPKRSDATVSQGMRFTLTLVSLVVGIPITAIALTQSGLAALAIAWAGIVLVNLVFARSSH